MTSLHEVFSTLSFVLCQVVFGPPVPFFAWGGDSPLKGNYGYKNKFIWPVSHLLSLTRLACFLDL